MYYAKRVSLGGRMSSFVNVDRLLLTLVVLDCPSTCEIS